VSRPVYRPRISSPRAAGRDPIAASALGHQPETLRAFLELYGTLWEGGCVASVTKETVRLRNAQITDCGY
jgi:alkylhydroperoxidase family enzyme